MRWMKYPSHILSKESKVGSNKACSQNTISSICGFEDDQVTFKGLCIL